MSVDLREEYGDLLIEKAELKRTIKRRQEKIKKLLSDIQALYQKYEEEEAKYEMIGEDKVKWKPDTEALELWSSAENVEEMQGVIVALKRKKAAIAAECSDVMLQLKNLSNT